MALQPLERRTLLCALHFDNSIIEELAEPNTLYSGPEVAADIVWINRGQSSDGFANTFGANAETARRVMDQVINDFERMIGSFNYSNGTGNFSLTVQMSGFHNGASAQLGSTLSGKPKSGTITMGRGGNGQGSGWFIDPTPHEHSEFMGTITNAFSGDAQGGSPAAGLGDFYTVAAAEITHVLGLFGSALPLWSSKTTNTGVADTAEGGGTGTFYVFQGPSIKHLLTSNNGGQGGQNFGSAVHGAGPGVPVSFGGDTYIGAQDIGNAVYEFGRRYIPSNTFALMFKDAFSYSTVDPAQFGTFYSIQRASDKQVMVRGGSGASTDIINISTSGNTLTVSVDVGDDVPGTGHLPGFGDLPAFVTHYDISDVASLNIQPGNGNDIINISSLPAGVNVTLVAAGGNNVVNLDHLPAGSNFIVSIGGGNDTLTIGGGDLSANIQGTFGSINLGLGSDTLILDDSNSTGTHTYTLDPSTFSRTGFGPVSVFNGVENVVLKANDFDNTILVNGNVSGRSIEVQSNGGNDTFVLGAGTLSNLPAPLTLNGGTGLNELTLDDSLTVAGHSYTVDIGSLTRSDFGGLGYSSVQTVRLLGALGNNTIVVNGTISGVQLLLNAGAGVNIISVLETATDSPVAIEALVGETTVNVNPDGTGTAGVVFDAPVTRLASLNIGAGGTAILSTDGSKVLVTNELTITGNGRLDLTNNAMIVDYDGSSPMDSIRTHLANGYAAGNWNGDGILSSNGAADLTKKTALGYGEASSIFSSFPAAFFGEEVDSTAVLVRYTRYGDANLDGEVNLSDFNRLAANFGTSNASWDQGNFNFDNEVDLFDFNLLAGNFGASAASLENLAARAFVVPPTARPMSSRE